MRERYKCNFDFCQKNFIAIDTPVEEKLMPDCVVLGWDKETKVLSIRSDQARGFGCHDFTDFGVQNRTNLIGTPIFSYTFAEAFRSPDNILAKPFLLTYRLNLDIPPLTSMNEDMYNRLKSILGIEYRTLRRGRRRGQRIVTGKPLNAVSLQISFDGKSSIAATAQDYATAMTIYRMIEQRQASKIMVFCWRNEECRRCLALFKLLLEQRIEEAKDNRELADRLSEVHSAHIYATWTRNEVTEVMEERVQKRLLYQFKMGKIEVLFNANLLSTGIDIPCTDAVVLTQRSRALKMVLQRWGRAPRSIATQPSKRGILAIVMSDPKESDEDKTKRKEFMGLDLAQKDDFGGCHFHFRNMYRAAEFAAQNSNRIIGERKKITPYLATLRRTSHRDEPIREKISGSHYRSRQSSPISNARSGTCSTSPCVTCWRTTTRSRLKEVSSTKTRTSSDLSRQWVSKMNETALNLNRKETRSTEPSQIFRETCYREPTTAQHRMPTRPSKEERRRGDRRGRID